MIQIAELEKLGLFNKMPREHLETLVNSMRPLHIDAGENLVTEGVTTHGPLLLITDGNVEVSRLDADGKKHTLAIIEPPTVIGEMEFLAELQSSATVTAHDDVTGSLLPRAQFEALFEKGDPAAYHLALSIGRFVSERLAETNVLLTKALARDPERMEKVQRAQFDSKALANIDAELEGLLD